MSGYQVREVALWTGARFDGFYWQLVRPDGSVDSQAPELPGAWAVYGPVQPLSAAEKRAIRVQVWGYDAEDWNPDEWEGEIQGDGGLRPLTDAEKRSLFERVDASGRVALKMAAQGVQASIRRKSDGLRFIDGRYVPRDVWEGEARATAFAQLEDDDATLVRVHQSGYQWGPKVPGYDPLNPASLEPALRAWMAEPSRQARLVAALAKFDGTYSAVVNPAPVAPVGSPVAAQAAAATASAGLGGLAVLLAPSTAPAPSSVVPPGGSVEAQTSAGGAPGFAGVLPAVTGLVAVAALVWLATRR